MGRGATTTLKNAMAEPVIRPIAFYEGEFASGTVRFWTGVGSRSWNSQTWLGGGNLVGVGPVTESAGLKADGLAMWLSGVDPAHVARALREVSHAKNGKLWFGLLDASGNVIADPVLLFHGRLDTAVIRRGKRLATIVVTYESHALDSQTRERRYTNEDQVSEYPDDQGFAYLTTLRQKQGLVSSIGDGGPCFSGNVRVQTPAGAMRLDQLPDECVVRNRSGARRARVLRHEYRGAMLEFRPGELVRKEHRFYRDERGWLPARVLFAKEVYFAGMVYNLAILDPDPEPANGIDDRSYLLESGDLVHNLKPRDDDGPRDLMP